MLHVTDVTCVTNITLVTNVTDITQTQCDLDLELQFYQF
jgi:hypothetical protein